MRTTTEILELICEIKQAHPELRFCQILSIAAKSADWEQDDLFSLPDKQLLKGLENMKNSKI